jgi:hypothetical protein
VTVDAHCGSLGSGVLGSGVLAASSRRMVLLPATGEAGVAELGIQRVVAEEEGGVAREPLRLVVGTAHPVSGNRRTASTS